MALLTSLIPPQRYETVRDRIGAILTDEILAQYVFHANPALKPKVWVERATPFANNELPAINVMFDNGAYSNKDVRQVDGTYTYLIDVHTAAKSTAGADGDKVSNINLQRIMGMCRAILESPQYRTLGIAPPYSCHVGVNSVRIAAPQKPADAASVVFGRVEYLVRIPETSNLMEAGPAFLPSLTTIKLYQTDKGYKYGSADLLLVDSDDMPDANIQLAFVMLGGTWYPVFDAFADRQELLTYLNTVLVPDADKDGEFLISGRQLFYSNPENYSDAEVMAIISQETTVFRVGTPPVGTVQPGLTVVDITNGSPLASSRLVNVDPAKVQIHIGTQFQEPLTEVWSIDVTTGVITFQPGIIPDNSLVYVNHTQQLIAP